MNPGMRIHAPHACHSGDIAARAPAFPAHCSPSSHPILIITGTSAYNAILAIELMGEHAPVDSGARRRRPTRLALEGGGGWRADDMIPIKIECACGQHYAFDVDPVDGRMPRAVACPACGADGTRTADGLIRDSLPQPPTPKPVVWRTSDGECVSCRRFDGTNDPQMIM